MSFRSFPFEKRDGEIKEIERSGDGEIRRWGDKEKKNEEIKTSKRRDKD